ncbi:MAG: hypothetical protein Q8Q08_02360 [Candidatus Omnitrophota bacterium]|nr:hypothetical protein [Candidatus Omnitrophota bacterium]
MKLTRIFSPLPVLFAAAFFIWFLSLRSYFFGDYALMSDAISYYDHIKYYMDSIARGMYPLWDPFYEGGGVPNEFFLRRAGTYNPFLYIYLLFHQAGLPARLAYLWFLGVYYFIGMIGFYLLSQRLLRDRAAAFLAFLLLLFSAMGTRLFDSYINFTFIPMIWFFYFGVAFFQSPRRYSLLGMTLSMMVLLTTYIPFYFLVIVLSFLFFFFVLYPGQVKAVAVRCAAFIARNKMLSLMCLMALILALVPGVMFFLSGREGEFVLPARSAEAPVRHAMGVDRDIVMDWAIAEDLLYSFFYLLDLRSFRFAVFYVPIFAGVIFLLGLITPFNRRLLFYLLWGGAILTLGSPESSGLYAFLYEHIFFFKYFRNLHFFLWFLILPVLILFLAEQMKLFFERRPQTAPGRYARIAFIVLVHAGLAVLVSWKGDPIRSTYLTLGLSLVLFLGMEWAGRTQVASTGHARGMPFLVVLLAVVALQPVEVYQGLKDSAPEDTRLDFYDRNPLYRYYKYEGIYDRFSFLRPRKLEVSPERGGTVKASIDSYYASKWVNALRGKMDHDVYQDYTVYRFILYDRVDVFDDLFGDEMVLEECLRKFCGTAYVPLHSGAVPPPGGHPPEQSSAEPVEESSGRIQLLKFGVNEVAVHARLDAPKFLVYNDAYHSGWRAFLDGKEIPLFRANMAFKGVWIPVGEHKVTFRFGSRWQEIGNWALIALFAAMLAGTAFWWRRASEEEEEEGRNAVL